MLTQTSTRLIARYYNEIACEPDVAKAWEVADEILTPEFIFHPPNDSEGQRGLSSDTNSSSSGIMGLLRTSSTRLKTS